MKITNPKYIKLLVEKYDMNENALIEKELVTTTEKVRMNSLIRDFSRKYFDEDCYQVIYQRIPILYYKSLANINVFQFFKENSNILQFKAKYKAEPVEFKISLYDGKTKSLKFNGEQVTLKTAKSFISDWIKAFDMGRDLGEPLEKELPRDSFYYVNEKGDFSICDNISGDCFCEDFKTKTDACKFLQGWSLEEIQFGEES